jgi:hypothetical protein
MARGPRATLVMLVLEELMDKLDVVDMERNGGWGCSILL